MFQADSLTITVVVDNQVDMLLPDTTSPTGSPATPAPASGAGEPSVTRYGLTEHFDPRRPPPLAENGLSVLVEAVSGRHRLRVLFDAALTGTTLQHNLHVLRIDPASVDQVVISHGHPDHFGGLEHFLTLAGSDGLPVVTHPDAELPRYAIMGDGRVAPHYNARFRFERIHTAGGEPVLARDPLDLGMGVHTTGQIPRREAHFEAHHPPHEPGRPGLVQVTAHGRVVRDEVPDEIGLIIDVKDEGLVVLTGCAHAGVINTLTRAREICGARPIRAVMGGFHLGFPTTHREHVQLTAEALRDLEVATIMPMHCSGLAAHARLSQGPLAKHYLQPSVGTVLHFGAPR